MLEDGSAAWAFDADVERVQRSSTLSIIEVFIDRLFGGVEA